VSTGLTTVTALFEKLSGQDYATSTLPAQKLEKVLTSAHGDAYAQTMQRYHSCAVNFAKACQRFTEGPRSLKAGLKEHYLHPDYLNHMAQAMPVLPDGSRQLMPIYFHNARWPYQFARDAARAADPQAHEVQTAVAQLRRQQASLLLQQRRAKRQPPSAAFKSHSANRWTQQQLDHNAQLLAPYNSMRAEMRRYVLEQLKAASQPQGNVLQLRPRMQAVGQPRVANL